MTPAERKRAFDRARAAVVRGRTSLMRSTRDDLVRLLKAAEGAIREQLASQPTDYQQWSLPQLSSEIRRTLDEFARDGGARISGAAGDAWSLGRELTEKPLVSAMPEASVASALPMLETTQLAAMRAFMIDRVKDIGVDAANKITAELGLVAIGAQSPSDAIGRVAEILGEASRARATTIVRTELGRAFSTAAQLRLEQAAGVVPGLKKQWRRSGKLHPRLHHDLADGQVREVNEPFVLKPLGRAPVELMYPRDPAAPASETINCFLPGTMISGLVQSAFRARYSGYAVRISTRAGLRLTVTPNHPVLAERGFAAARALREGDRLVCDATAVEGRTRSAPAVDINEQPIQEIFRAFGKTAAFRRPGREGDLHGDVRSVQGEIEVVGAAASLLRDREAARAQRGGKQSLESPGMGAAPLAGQRPPPLAAGGVALAAARAPCAPRLLLDGRPAGSFQREPHEAVRFGSAAQIDAGLTKLAGEDVPAEAAFLRELQQRFPGAVLLDEVLSLHWVWWSGWVYDVESPRHWIMACGILASNCGCESIPFKDDWKVLHAGREPGSPLLEDDGDSLQAVLARQRTRVPA
ncbi:MAG: hypothetical protein ACT4P3_09485 [Betaproteobacteria bacterium]